MSECTGLWDWMIDIDSANERIVVIDADGKPILPSKVAASFNALASSHDHLDVLLDEARESEKRALARCDALATDLVYTKAKLRQAMEACKRTIRRHDMRFRMANRFLSSGGRCDCLTCLELQVVLAANPDVGAAQEEGGSANV